MGGRAGRSALVVLLASAVLLPGAVSPHVVGADDDVLAGPPFAEPVVRVKVTWGRMKDLSFEYSLTNSFDPLGDPYAFDFINRVAGCPGAKEGRPLEPLLLPDRRGTPSWINGWPTEYALVITSQGVCSTHDLEKQWKIVERVGDVQVRATVEHWAPGAAEPRTQELKTIVAPVIYQESNVTPFRRRFEDSIEFGQATGSATLDPVPSDAGATGSAWAEVDESDRLTVRRDYYRPRVDYHSPLLTFWERSRYVVVDGNRKVLVWAIHSYDPDDPTTYIVIPPEPDSPWLGKLVESPVPVGPNEPTDETDDD